MEMFDWFVVAMALFCTVWSISLNKQKKALEKDKLDAKKKAQLTGAVVEIVGLMDNSMERLKFLAAEIEKDKEINNQLTADLAKLREKCVTLAKDNIFLRSMAPSAEGKKPLYDVLNKQDILLHFSYVSDVLTQGYMDTGCSVVLHPESSTFSLYRDSDAVLKHEPMSSVPALMRWIDSDAILDKMAS